MGNMKVQFFNTVDDYFTLPSDEETYSVTLAELKNACDSLGLFERKFNHKLVDFLKASLECCIEEDGGLKCSDSFKAIESTFKGMASTVLGMTVTKVIAEKKYQVSSLFHLRDKVLFDHSDKRFFIPGSKKIPDFFGVDAQMNAFLFEAKGCSLPKGSKTKHVPSGDMRKAVEQLQSINAVVIAHSGKRNQANTGTSPSIAYGFNAHASSSGKSQNAFAVGAGFIQGELSAWVVDPIADSSFDLIINPYQAIYDYYAPFTSLIEKGKDGGDQLILDNRPYYRAKGSDSLCIFKETLDYLKESHSAYKNYRNRFRTLFTGQKKSTIDDGGSKEELTATAEMRGLVPIEVDDSAADWLLWGDPGGKNKPNPFEELNRIEETIPSESVGAWVLRKDGIAVRNDLS